MAGLGDMGRTPRGIRGSERGDDGLMGITVQKDVEVLRDAGVGFGGERERELGGRHLPQGFM
jgi:hypothetical protein